jgi:hypothetical protein
MSSSILTIKPYRADSSGHSFNTISRLTLDTSQTYQDHTTMANKRFRLLASATCKLHLRSGRQGPALPVSGESHGATKSSRGEMGKNVRSPKCSRVHRPLWPGSRCELATSELGRFGCLDSAQTSWEAVSFRI